MRIPNIPLIFRAIGRSVSRPSANFSLQQNLEAAYQWLCAAQDVSADDGVAGWYSLIKGWSASYPESTGYIIPTFLAYAKAAGNAEAKQRALRMADWEVEVQLPDGAARSGVLSTRVGPSVFNTGQVLFGLTAAYCETGGDHYARSAQKAAEWLVREQDDDGAWRKNLSLLTTTKVQTYNVRAAWGLAIAGHVFDNHAWLRAAAKNCDWALTQQNAVGWFANNSFYENEVPLLHTIAYTLEGLLGAGEILGQERFVDAALQGIEPLVNIYQKTHRLHGRYDGAWRNPVRWRCLTGEAQISLILGRISKYRSKDDAFVQVGKALITDVGMTQDMVGPLRENRGAIAGSEPIWGGYCPLAYVNWAAKFYLDALILSLFGTDVQPTVLRTGNGY